MFTKYPISIKQNLRMLSLLALTVVASCIFLVPVSAATGSELNAQVAVTGYTGDPLQLSLKAGEDVYNAAGKLVLIKDNDIGASFTKRAGGYAADAILYEGVNYYVSDGVEAIGFVAETSSIVVNFSEGVITDDEGTVHVEGSSSGSDDEIVTADSVAGSEPSSGVSSKSVDAPDKSSDVINLKTSAPEEAVVGKTVKYTVDALTASKNNNSDAFLVQIDIPDGMKLINVSTGKYNKQVKLDVLCKTEKENKWNMWYEGIDSLTDTVCDTNSSSISDEDRIVAVAVACDNVPEGFEMDKQTPMTYTMEVLSDSGEVSEGFARLSAYVNGKKEVSEGRQVSQVSESSAVQTGDDNYIVTISVLLIILSQLTMWSLIVFRVVMHKKEQKSYDTPFTVSSYGKADSGGSGKKMAALIRDKSG